MEVIPDNPEFGPSDSKRNVAQPKRTAAHWLLRQQKESHSTTTPEAPMRYELDISPGMKATVELSDKSEIEFERRHEVRDESVLSPQKLSRMTPLSQVLADYPPRQDGSRAKTQNSIAFSKTSKSSPISSRSLYKKAFQRGVLLGIVAGCIGLFIFLTVSS